MKKVLAAALVIGSLLFTSSAMAWTFETYAYKGVVTSPGVIAAYQTNNFSGMTATAIPSYNNVSFGSVTNKINNSTASFSATITNGTGITGGQATVITSGNSTTASSSGFSKVIQP